MPWLVSLAAAALLLITFSGWWWLTPTRRMTTPTPIASSIPTPAPAPPSVVPSVEQTGTHELRLSDGSLLSFHTARYRVEVADNRIALLDGRVEATIAKRLPEHPLVIVTPQGEATIVGTVFTLVTDGTATVLRVSEGTVRFANRAVSAGETQLIDDLGPATRTIYLDANSGPTLAEVDQHLGPGDAVVLGPGTHRSSRTPDVPVKITSQASAMNPARITAMPSAETILRGGDQDLLQLTGNHLILTGIRFIGAATGEGNGLVIDGNTDFRIRRCRFEGFGGDGMNTHGVNGLRIEDCAFVGNGLRSHYGQGGLSLFLSAGGGDTVLRQLRCTGNQTGPTNVNTGIQSGGHGLLISHDDAIVPGSSVLLDDCLIADNEGPGLSIIDAGMITVRRCHILANGQGPVGDLKAQITGVFNSHLSLSDTVIAADPGTDLLRLWEPANVGEAKDNQVWGGKPPGQGFTSLDRRPSAKP